MEERRIGLAIGAGAVRGFSAIGILKVLEKHKIPVDFIAGTSIGAVIGASYSSGLSAKQLEEVLTHTNFKRMVDFTLPEKGLVRGKSLEKFLRKLFMNKQFSDLEIPLSVIATDLSKGKVIEFNKGDVTTAVRASMSIPSVFNPVEIDNMVLVDGGLMNPLPVDIVKKNAKKIVALDFNPQFTSDAKVTNSPSPSRKKRKGFVVSLKDKLIKAEIENIKEYINVKKIKLPLAFRFFLDPKRITNYLSSFPFSTPKIFEINVKSMGVSINEISRLKLKETKVDILIRPSLPGVKMFDFNKASFCIKQGEKAALKEIKNIKNLIR